MLGDAWQEFEAQRRKLEAETGQGYLPLGVILFLDDFEVYESRLKSDTGVYIMLANDSLDNLLSTRGLEMICLLPKGYPLFECLDLIIVRAMQRLEKGVQLFWPLSNQTEWFVGKNCTIIL